MRFEMCVALLASIALHAGLLVITPGSVASRDSATAVSAVPRIITARLENTFVPSKAARAARTHAAQPASVGRAIRTSNTSRPEPRANQPLRFYPPEAIARGLEGEAILMLRFGANGALVDAQIAKSSGHAILDEAALRAVRATQRFASGPREMLFPVTFALR